MRLFFVLLTCCLSYIGVAQVQHGLGGKVGVSVSLGTHVDRVGVVLSGFQYYDFFQVNVEARFNYNFKTYGAVHRTPEMKLSVGGVLGYGERSPEHSGYIGYLGNQTQKQNAVAYSYHIYRDKIRTSQRSGSWALQFGHWNIITENDVFSGTGRDQFRTGGILLGYRVDDTMISLQTAMWTGETRGEEVSCVRDSNYPSRFGYNDLSRSWLGKRSFGILALRADHELTYGQVATASMGLDSERVRHFMQNRLVHDALLIPKRFDPPQNPHYPMLTGEGLPYLFRPEQQVRPTRVYLNFEANSPWFY